MRLFGHKSGRKDIINAFSANASALRLWAIQPFKFLYMHNVAVLALPGFVLFDLGIPCGVFNYIELASGEAPYHVSICSEHREVKTRTFSLVTDGTLQTLAMADTVIIPGVEDPDLAVSPNVIAAIKAAWNNGARIASICSGAFVLAATGLLNGKRATTHWLAAAALAQRYPEINVDANVLYVDEGRIVTSAGATAGLDMCLHLVRCDYGASIAAEAARRAVIALERDGGQRQFIRHEPPQSGSNLAPLLEWLLDNLNQQIDVATLAAKANLSSRTFARKFRAQTGTTPLQWLITARVKRSQELLESTSASIDAVAAAVGFSDAVAFRDRFKSQVGLSPSRYRRQFRNVHVQ